MRIALTPVQAPNANAYAERFVRSIREECLDHLILFGERRLRHVLKEFVVHYHEERNHQGLDNDLIAPAARAIGGARVRCRECLAACCATTTRRRERGTRFSDSTGVAVMAHPPLRASHSSIWGFSALNGADCNGKLFSSVSDGSSMHGISSSGVRQ